MSDSEEEEPRRPVGSSTGSARKGSRRSSDREQRESLLAPDVAQASDADGGSRGRASISPIGTSTIAAGPLSSPISPAPEPISSPQSTAPFAALSGGDTPPHSGSSVMGHRVAGGAGHELMVDHHHPLPASSPPPFLHMPSPSPSPPPPPGPEAMRRLSSPESGAESMVSLWWSRIRQLMRLTTWGYFIRHARHEMRKRKCTYALGLFSCFLVVCVAAVCHTLIARAPVVFLQQAETASGQIDLQLTPSAGSYLNYTALAGNVARSSEFALHTARAWYEVAVLPASQCPAELDPFSNQWKYVGLDPTDPTSDAAAGCSNRSTTCITSLCTFAPLTLTQDAPLWTIDTARERSMGLGRRWSFEAPGRGEAFVTRDLARLWHVGVGDVVQLRFGPALRTLVSAAMAWGVEWDGRKHPERRLDANATLVLDALVSKFGGITYVPFTVTRVLDSTLGKFSDDYESLIVVEQEPFLEYVLEYLHPALTETVDLNDMAELLGSSESLVIAAASSSVTVLPVPLAGYPMLYPSTLASMDSFAMFVLFNLPGSRVDAYLSTDFDTIQSRLVAWSSRVVYFAGFTQVQTALPVLSEMDGVKMFSLYLGLILSIILTILFLLSALLIYSLLMISVESRAFELGVQRMCGMTRVKIIQLLTVQALSFAIPAWVIGLTLSQIVVGIVIARVEAKVEVPLSRLLTGESIGVATGMGLLLPLVASILPIRTALATNLQDALDTTHSKTVGVAFSIERSVDAGIDTAWLALGVCLTVLGGSIYYMVPLALVSSNLSLFFDIFFALLLGMLLGLILLSLNFQPLLERIVVALCLWWERRAITFVVLRNLVTHRVRNRKTSIMFALSLGFILFITVAFQIELYTAKARTYRNYGAEMVVYPRRSGASGAMPSATVAQLESILLDHSDTVATWGWVSSRLGWADEWDDTWISNVGHAYSNGIEVWGASSNLFETTLNEYLVRDSDTPKMSDTPLTEQLYTPAGSQAAILGANNMAQFGLHSTNGEKTSFLYALQRRQSTSFNASLQFHRMRPLTFLDLCPHFNVGRFPTTTAQPTVVSLTTFQRLAGNAYPRVRDVPMSSALLKFTPDATNRMKDRLAGVLKTFVSAHSFQLWDMRTVVAQLDESNAVMSLVFSVATYISMFLCLFSLVASMLSNIHEQAKEIAVLRAVGLTRRDVVRIYTFEAFVLVMSASGLGIGIGLVMSGTLVAQRVLFTQLPVPFLFPWTVLLYTFTGSILCAIIASMMPARKLLQRSIASIMKSIL